MSKMFDDLFDKFFGRKPKIDEPKSNEKDIPMDFVSKLFESLSDSNNFETNFGPPTNVEYYEEDGLYFKKEIWELEGGGLMSHVIGSSKPFDKPIILTYDEQLAIALENEDYEEAARLRDEIKLINK